MSAVEAGWPIRVGTTEKRVCVPSWEVESERSGDGGVWEHGLQNGEDFRLDLRVVEGLDANGEVSLWTSCELCLILKRKWEKRTVTVTKKRPEPGKKLGWSRLCHTGYRPRSLSAYKPILESENRVNNNIEKRRPNYLTSVSNQKC